ncbi:symporter small accessory protein [Bacteroides sp.]
MFGINDPLILLPYLLSILCVVFAVWFGWKYWNKDDEKDKTS